MKFALLLLLFSVNLLASTYEYSVNSHGVGQTVQYQKEGDRWNRTITVAPQTSDYYTENYGYEALNFVVELNSNVFGADGYEIDPSLLSTSLQVMGFALVRLDQMRKLSYKQTDTVDIIIKSINHRVNSKISDFKATSSSLSEMYQQVQKDLVTDHENLKNDISKMSEKVEAELGDFDESLNDHDFEDRTSTLEPISFDDDFETLSKDINTRVHSIKDASAASRIRTLNELSVNARTIDVESAAIIQDEALRVLYKAEGKDIRDVLSKRDRNVVGYFETRGQVVKKQNAIAHKIKSGGYAPDQLKTAENSLELSGNLSAFADQSYSVSSVEESMGYMSMAKEVADLGLSLTPGVSIAKDIYELFLGKNLVTGEELSIFDRAICAVGIVTMGSSNYAKVGIKALSKVGKIAKVGFKSALKYGDNIVHSAQKSGLFVGTKFTDLKVNSSYETVKSFFRTLGSSGVPLPVKKSLVKSFDLKTIKKEIVNSDLYVYRWHNNDELARKLGRFVTDNPVADKETARKLLALPADNKMLHLDKFKIKKGTEIYAGKVAPLNGHPGGGSQIFITGDNIEEILIPVLN